MRIESNRSGAVTSRSAARGASGQGATFQILDSGAAPRAAALSPGSAANPVGALLALQAVEDATSAVRRQVRRGLSLLDALEELKLDLLTGQIGEGRLNRLMALVGQARRQSDPALDALIDDIELRARVELAKRGIYPR